MVRARTLTLVLLAACQRRPANQEGPTTCDAAFATDLAATLGRACAVEGGPTTTVALPTSPWSSTDPLPDAIPVAITEAGASMGMEQHATVPLSELRPIVEEEFGKLRELNEGKGDKTPPKFILLIAKDAPLGRIAEVLDMLETAGHRNGALVLASGTQPPAPPPVYPEAFARLRDKASSELADVHVKQTADAALEAVDDCEAARVLFTELAHVGAGERCEILTTKMPAAIVECDCERAPELTSLVQKLTAVDAPVLEADAIVLDRAAAIAVDPAQTWGDFIAKRTTGFDRLWFTTR